jgi:hypothetical protein
MRIIHLIIDVCSMIHLSELRTGNCVLQKILTRIQPVVLTPELIGLIGNGKANEFFPIVLSGPYFEKAGFIENKKYPLLPQAHEYLMDVPVQSSSIVQLKGYIKNNNESFARLFVNDLPASNPSYQLHQVQNLFYSLTGEELTVRLK